MMASVDLAQCPAHAEHFSPAHPSIVETAHIMAVINRASEHLEQNLQKYLMTKEVEKLTKVTPGPLHALQAPQTG